MGDVPARSQERDPARDGWLFPQRYDVETFDEAIQLALSNLTAAERKTCVAAANAASMMPTDWVMSRELRDRYLALPVEESTALRRSWQALFVADGADIAAQVDRLESIPDSDGTRTALAKVSSLRDASRLVNDDEARLLSEAVNLVADGAGVDATDWGALSAERKAALFAGLPGDDWGYSTVQFENFDQMMEIGAVSRIVYWDALPTSVPAGTVARLFEICDGKIIEVQGDMWAFLRDTTLGPRVKLPPSEAYMTGGPAIEIAASDVEQPGTHWIRADQEPSVILAEIAAACDLPAGTQPSFAIVGSRGFCEYPIHRDTPIGRVSVVASGISDKGPAFAGFAQMDDVTDADLAGPVAYAMAMFENSSRGEWPSPAAYAEARLEVHYDDLDRISHLIDFERHAADLDCVYVRSTNGVHVFFTPDLAVDIPRNPPTAGLDI